MLESRFDNVLMRLGFAASRRQARRMINHGHWLINGRRVDIASYQVRRPDDVITIRPDSGVTDVVRQATEVDGSGAAVAAGRSRRTYGEGVPASQRSEITAGRRAAHRRALLEVVGPFSTRQAKRFQ